MANEKTNIRDRSKVDLKKPDMYYVIMHNDDFTTMEFVVKVLKVVFFKDSPEAVQLMMTVHKQGCAKIGLYTYDIAQSKSQRAMKMAREEGYPFKLTIEPDTLPF